MKNLLNATHAAAAPTTKCTETEENSPSPKLIKKVTSFHLPKKSFDYDRLSAALINCAAANPAVTITDECNSHMSSEERLVHDSTTDHLNKSTPEIQSKYTGVRFFRRIRPFCVLRVIVSKKKTTCFGIFKQKLGQSDFFKFYSECPFTGPFLHKLRILQDIFKHFQTFSMFRQIPENLVFNTGYKKVVGIQYPVLIKLGGGELSGFQEKIVFFEFLDWNFGLWY